MVWYDPRTWGSSDPQAKVDAAQKKVDEATRELEAAKAELSGVQQGEALSGPEPPVAMGGKRRKSKKTRRGKKVKGTRRH